MNILKNFLVALQFLTNITVSKKLGEDKEVLGKSTLYFPIIGIFIGCFLAGIYIIFSRVFPDVVVSVIIIISIVWITRGLHLDGFIDTVDGLFGGKDRDERLRIMKDSQIGSFGVAAVVCLILFKFTLILEIFLVYKNLILISSILILMPAVARWSMVLAMHFFPYARESGTGGFARFVGLKEVLIATAIMLIFSIGLLKFEGILIMLAAFIFMLLFSKYISSKIGGMTGDTYGALNEVIEVLVLLILLISFQN